MIAEPKTQQLFEFDTIEDVLSDVAHGKIVIVTDDADRENEGDLVIAAGNPRASWRGTVGV